MMTVVNKVLQEISEGKYRYENYGGTYIDIAPKSKYGYGYYGMMGDTNLDIKKEALAYYKKTGKDHEYVAKAKGKYPAYYNGARSGDNREDYYKVLELDIKGQQDNYE